VAMGVSVKIDVKLRKSRSFRQYAQNSPRHRTRQTDLMK
jgi:hypothetical protein